MISNLSIFFMILSVMLSTGLPIYFSIYMHKKYGVSLKAVVVGALMFFIFQFVLRIPILTYIQSMTWYKGFASSYTVITLILIALSAALFETAGRYIGLKYLLIKKLDWENSIAYGIGHGGIESIMLVGINYIAIAALSIMSNYGRVDASLVSQLVSVSPAIYLAGGLERVFTMMFHVGAAMLVAYGILTGRKKYILYCLLAHTAVDTIAPLMNALGINVWVIESFVAVVGVLSLIYVLKSKRLFDELSKSKAADIGEDGNF